MSLQEPTRAKGNAPSPVAFTTTSTPPKDAKASSREERLRRSIEAPNLRSSASSQRQYCGALTESASNLTPTAFGGQAEAGRISYCTSTTRVISSPAPSVRSFTTHRRHHIAIPVLEQRRFVRRKPDHLELHRQPRRDELRQPRAARPTFVSSRSLGSPQSTHKLSRSHLHTLGAAVGDWKGHQFAPCSLEVK